MAAPSNWRESINDFPVFREFKGSLDTKKTPHTCTNVLYALDDLLFVWNHEESHLHVSNLNQQVLKSGVSSSQILLCTDPPIFEVTNIDINSDGSHVALYGKRGVYIMVLPRRWESHGLYEGGKESCLCKTYGLAERFFACHRKLSVLHVAWHPASVGGSHILVLSSDNAIRLFDLGNSDQALKIIWLSDGDRSFSRLNLSASSFTAALGDQAVSFTFGPPVDLETLRTRREYMWKKTAETLAHPVYVLWGNGDVYMVLVTLSAAKCPWDGAVLGPLDMYPPAEDNYGTEACSILVTSSTPPVAVIATCSGKLYHCVIINPDGDDDDRRSELSWAPSDSTTRDLDVTPPKLYAYESVELELSLATVAVETDDILVDPFMCPIRLHSDVSTASRYHCSHSAGVHCVEFPWLQRLQHYAMHSEDDDVRELLADGEEAVVEHLICTKPLPSSDAAPIRGTCVYSSIFLGTSLLSLTADGSCVALALSENVRFRESELLTSQTDANDKALSPLRKLTKQPFDEHIRQLLQRSSTNPLLLSGGNSTMTPQECFQLLCRATQIFRDEYIHKQEIVQEEIARRVKLLQRQKAHQQKELKELMGVRQEIKDDAENLAEKYEEIAIGQDRLTDRIYRLLRKLQTFSPVLSDAERSMNQELTDMDGHMKTLENSLEQIKTKREYQEKKISVKRQRSKDQPTLSHAQLTNIKGLLSNEGNQIESLLQQVNDLKLTLDV